MSKMYNIYPFYNSISKRCDLLLKKYHHMLFKKSSYKSAQFTHPISGQQALQEVFSKILCLV
jgi:hypothetical protein